MPGARRGPGSPAAAMGQARPCRRRRPPSPPPRIGRIRADQINTERPRRAVMAEVTVVRYTHDGDKFEILVRPDPALEYRLGRRKDIASVLVSDDVYSDSGKGTKPSSELLHKAFGTDDAASAAKAILEGGELSLTTDQRRRMIEEKRRQVVEHIAKTYVDPRTHLPHPPLRIEQAMKEARVSIDPQKSAGDQVKDVVDRLRGVVPLKSENVALDITVPAQFVSQSYGVLKSIGTLKGEAWGQDGSLKAILEIPAAARPRVIDRLGSATKGTATVEVRQ